MGAGDDCGFAHGDAELRPAESLQVPWLCPRCGFHNAPSNAVCGGGGSLGCRGPWKAKLRCCALPRKGAPAPHSTVFVKGVDPSLPEAEVADFFWEQGEVVAVAMRHRHVQPTISGFVEYAEAEGAHTLVSRSGTRLGSSAIVATINKTSSAHGLVVFDRTMPFGVIPVGESAMFTSHVGSDAAQQPDVPAVCCHFLRGSCTFGAQCRRSHTDDGVAPCSGAPHHCTVHRARNEVAAAAQREAGGNARKWVEGPGTWRCPACSFANRAMNNVCGGDGGVLGCKAPRPATAVAVDAKRPRTAPQAAVVPVAVAVALSDC